MASSNKPTTVKEAIAQFEAARSKEGEKFIAAAAEKVHPLSQSPREQQRPLSFLSKAPNTKQMCSTKGKLT